MHHFSKSFKHLLNIFLTDWVVFIIQRKYLYAVYNSNNKKNKSNIAVRASDFMCRFLSVLHIDKLLLPARQLSQLALLLLSLLMLLNVLLVFLLATLGTPQTINIKMQRLRAEANEDMTMGRYEDGNGYADTQSCCWSWSCRWSCWLLLLCICEYAAHSDLLQLWQQFYIHMHTHT